MRNCFVCRISRFVVMKNSIYSRQDPGFFTLRIDGKQIYRSEYFDVVVRQAAYQVTLTRKQKRRILELAKIWDKTSGGQVVSEAAD